MWFDYPDDSDGGRVKISNLDEQDIAAITAVSLIHRTVYDLGKNKPVQEQSFDHLADRQETCVRSVRDWENFFDADGAPMPCTEVAKRQWACSNFFMAFANDCRAIVTQAANDQQAAKEKN
jgi:hypothetical protein